MKLYGGIDLHSNNSVVAIKDETGNVLVCNKFKDIVINPTTIF
jgi:transposase